jgi:hypothetical protein
MYHCVTGWVVPDILKDWSACIFRVKQAKSKQPFHLWICNPEGKDTTILHSVWNYSPNDTMSHPRRPESLAKLLWELHNLQLRQHSTLIWLCSPSPSQKSGILMTGHLKVPILAGQTETWAYLYGPMAVLLFLNTVYFMWTAWRLWKDCQGQSAPKLRRLRFTWVFILQRLCDKDTQSTGVKATKHN